jgi:hypothetical protein
LSVKLDVAAIAPFGLIRMWVTAGSTPAAFAVGT